ncbi:MAG: transglutaminase domain-containing protein, partial [Sulfuricellaceae bacterium]|nr:transglutaminase domain-containing protein [Sulfuricellaceae bacterium]
ESVKELRRQKTQLDALEQDVLDDLKATETHLKAKNLPPEIINRHKTAVADYKTRQAQFKQKLKSLEADDDRDDENARSSSVTDLAAWLEQNQPDKPHVKTDPNKLPFRTPDSKVRAPAETARDLRAKLGLNPIRVAGPLPQGTNLFAAALDPKAPPTADDLAASEDVQITPAIRAQAAALSNNPVQIHNWVRNTIEFIPSYGSIQGSEMTLQAKRGNAFDTASLEIALLRAAGIPARYVYGTIQLPASQAMNWVGGVTQPDAALNLLGQGGIPSVGLVSGGKVSAVKLEHVWVEAYVDYVPSRGAVNKVPDTWVPLDASFKQYQYTQGMDIKGNVPLDAAALLAQAQAGATVNTAEGWVRNLNQANIQSALTGYQTQVQSYVTAQNANATVGDVLGSKKIPQRNHAILPGTLPYKTVAVGSRFSSFPVNLRHQFKYSLYTDEHTRSLDLSVFSFQQSLPNLAGKKVTLSFVPASQADADTIASFLPKPHADGTPIQPGELPTSLPAYLIHVTAQLKVEGEIVAQGGHFTLGQELVGEGGFTLNGLDGWDVSPDSTLVAGQASAIGLNLQGVSASQFKTLKVRMEQTKTKLQANDVSGLTGDLITGDLLTANVWGYFGAVDSLGRLSQSTANTIDLPGLSYGLFHAVVAPMKTFGVVMSVTFPGVMMDIGHLRHLRVAKDNDTQNWINYNRMRGQQQSVLEATVPEQFFTDPGAANKPEGVSAAKIIAIAAAQGQKIFTITSANAAAALPQIQQSASVMAEIQNALNAGNEVTVSEKPVTVAGWTGAGYIVIDPATGVGGYLIEGRANGGWLSLLGAASAALSSLVVGFTGLYVAVWLFALLAAVTLAIIIAAEVEGIDFKTYSKSIDVISLCALLPFFGYLGMAGVVAGILILLVTAYIKLLASALKEEFTKYA